MSELKPCPFCGGAPHLIGADQNMPLLGWFVKCDGCGASQKITEGADSGAAAIEAWNRRAQPAQAVVQHLADDERVAALCDLSYVAGMKAGWNFCVSDDGDGFERSQNSVGEAIRILKAHRAIEQAVLAKRVPQWLPIETAPRGSGEDGPSNTTDPAYIEPPHLLLLTREGVRVGYYDWYYHPGYGRGADPNELAWRGSDGERLYEPTHWMPLPPPPGIVDEKEATS